MTEPLYEAEVLGRRVLSRADRAYFPGEIVILPLSEAEELERRGIVFVLDLVVRANGKRRVAQSVEITQAGESRTGSRSRRTR